MVLVNLSPIPTTSITVLARIFILLIRYNINWIFYETILTFRYICYNTMYYFALNDKRLCITVQCCGQSWLARSPPDQAARHITLTVLLSTQVYKWVQANLMLGVTLQRTSILFREEQRYSESVHATETEISSGQGGHFTNNIIQL